MISFFEKLPEKYEVGFEDVKYPYGATNLIYSLKKNELLARVSKNQSDIFYSTVMVLHEKNMSDKLLQKGYPIPKVEGVYKIFQKNWNIFQPGTVMEDKSDFVMLKNVPEVYSKYFRDYYEEILTNAERDGFFIGDVNEGNCLCELKKREVCLIDFDDWEYLGKGKKVINPRSSYFM